MRSRQDGFTLIELVVVLVVSAALLGVGVPSMLDLVRNNRLATTANALVADLYRARAEAVRLRERVTVCISTDGASCSDSANWDAGWIVFVDENGDAARDGGEILLREHAALHEAVSMQGNGPVAHYISYLPSGLPRQTSGALQMGSVLVCEQGQARRVVINAMGRTRVEKTTC